MLSLLWELFPLADEMVELISFGLVSVLSCPSVSGQLMRTYLHKMSMTRGEDFTGDEVDEQKRLLRNSQVQILLKAIKLEVVWITTTT